MEQSVIEQDFGEDFKTVSIPQTHRFSLQDEIDSQHQASRRIQVPQVKPQG